MKTQLHFIFLLFLSIMLNPERLFGQAGTQPNIIIILIDDLNDYTTSLGGHPQTLTPNIDRIEDWGTTFTNAHASAPKCTPSRTSFISGKDLYYTHVYNNMACKPFREYFDPDEGNGEVFTLPEYFKDQGGYFTFGINKIIPCFDTYYDYDSLTLDPCAKSLSWSKYSLFIDGEDTVVLDYGDEHNYGFGGFSWYPLPDSLEPHMYDYRTVDTAALFLQEYSDGSLDACEKPFLMMLGFRKPHEPYYIPEKYFDPYYCDDLYQDPLDLPYNDPINTVPYNGVVMPPQPDTLYNDFFQLPENGLGQYMGAFDSIYFEMLEKIDDLDPLPNVADGLTDEQRVDILQQVYSANFTLAYSAAVRYLDAQIGRLLDSLALYPDIMDNTIIVLTSDHGYSLGEKRHWKKGTLWETDQRVPFVISDLRAPLEQSHSTAVSLLDIFPTLCDMAEIPQPTFTDGTPYLDGQSVLYLINDPALDMERPAISAYKQRKTLQLSCRPQYSLRSDRFHYILYTSNGPAGTLECDGENYFLEEELYEIGTDRNIDPNEWNNLANNPDYRPVIEYLQQWLPDSALYLDKNFIAQIAPLTNECLPGVDDVLTLSVDMFDELGYAITPPDSFTYVWSNNLTDTLIYGTNGVFPLNTIPDTIYDTHDQMLWYLHAINADGITRAFDLRTVYFDPTTTPYASFNLEQISALTIEVVDLSFTGAYTDVRWDFGDGVIIEEDIPGPYTYPETGTYTVTCMLYYGNDTACVETESVALDVVEVNNDQEDQLALYPNPTSGLLHIASGQPFHFGELCIYDLTGRMLYFEPMPAGPIYDHQVDVRFLPQGMYVMRYRNTTERYAAGFIVGGK